MNDSFVNDQGFDIVDGLEGQLLRYLVTEYQMKLTLIAPPDMEYGLKNGHGNWTGKFGLLMRGEVDLVIGMIPGNYKRLEVGNYLASLFNSRFLLISRKPPSQVSWTAPLHPFPYTIWAFLGGSIATFSILVWWITNVFGNLNQTSPNPNRKAYRLGILSQVLKRF